MKILESERLVLRRLLISDLDSLFVLYRDPDVRRYIPEGTRLDRTLTYEETKEELERFLNGHPSHPELGLWATVHKESDEFIGRCGLLPWTLQDRHEVEVAYLLDKQYWGQGLATEAARAIVEYAFGRLGLSRLICMIEPENDASIKVASKIGMSLEAKMEDDKGPFLLWSMTKEPA